MEDCVHSEIRILKLFIFAKQKGALSGFRKLERVFSLEVAILRPYQYKIADLLLPYVLQR